MKFSDFLTKLFMCRVYCKYHYLEGHETNNPEEELWNFLVKLSKNEIDITQKQYTEETQSKNFSFDGKILIWNLFNFE